MILLGDHRVGIDFVIFSFQSHNCVFFFIFENIFCFGFFFQMVSLNTEQGRPGGVSLKEYSSIRNSFKQGMSFDDRVSLINDEITHDRTPLILNTQQQYRPIRTTIFIIFHILFMVRIFRKIRFSKQFRCQIIFEIIIVLFPYLCYDKNLTKLCDHHSVYNISLYIHASTYFISVVFDRYGSIKDHVY